jgi:hypothetical protein
VALESRCGILNENGSLILIGKRMQWRMDVLAVVVEVLGRVLLKVWLRGKELVVLQVVVVVVVVEECRLMIMERELLLEALVLVLGHRQVGALLERVVVRRVVRMLMAKVRRKSAVRPVAI